jgi:hypothetical protein
MTLFFVIGWQVVNCAQLLSKGEGKKSSSNITTAFKDTRLMDAVLVLEDFQVKI